MADTKDIQGPVNDHITLCGFEWRDSRDDRAHEVACLVVVFCDVFTCDKNNACHADSIVSMRSWAKRV